MKSYSNIKYIFFCIVDHSKGVYMHDHPDFPSVIGGGWIHFTEQTLVYPDLGRNVFFFFGNCVYMILSSQYHMLFSYFTEHAHLSFRQWFCAWFIYAVYLQDICIIFKITSPLKAMQMVHKSRYLSGCQVPVVHIEPIISTLRLELVINIDAKWNWKTKCWGCFITGICRVYHCFANWDKANFTESSQSILNSFLIKPSLISNIN